jgi:hypothetical protein
MVMLRYGLTTACLCCTAQAFAPGTAASSRMLSTAAPPPVAVASAARSRSSVRLSNVAEGAFGSVARTHGDPLDVLENAAVRRASVLPLPGSSVSPLPPTLQPGGGGGGEDPNGRDEKNFELALGKLIDTLSQDYPLLFTEPPDFSVYSPSIVLKDPSGVVLKGMRSYRQMFAVLRFFRSTVMEGAETSFRLHYDWVNSRVRVRWHTVVVPKGRQTRFIVDGISAYRIDAQGLVYQHDLESIEVNGKSVTPPFGKAWINLDKWVMDRPGLAAPSTYFKATLDLPQPTVASSHETKAKPRSAKKQAESPLPSFLGAWPKVTGCEDSWDCDSPMICCDFALFKVCCNEGLGSPAYEPAYVPIPIPVERDYPQYPRW